MTAKMENESRDKLLAALVDEAHDGISSHAMCNTPREILIASCPGWLRDRLDHLLLPTAATIHEMPPFPTLDEGPYFWISCSFGEFEKAIGHLKEKRPDAYDIHYKKYFEKKQKHENNTKQDPRVSSLR